MARSEKAEAASSKPNRGQDEVTHTIQSADGTETLEVTQREWKETYRDAGYVKLAGPDDDEEETDEEGEPVPL